MFVEIDKALRLPPILRDGPAGLLRMRVFARGNIFIPHPEERRSRVAKDKKQQQTYQYKSIAA